MKKLLLLMCVILNGCCLDCGIGSNGYPQESLIYQISNNPAVSEATSFANPWDKDNFIGILTNYELPEKHTKDFLNTVILFLTTPELIDNAEIGFGYSDGDKIILRQMFYSHKQVTIDNNTDYNSLIEDPKNINFYTHTLTFSTKWLGIQNKVQIHLRQDLEPNMIISYLIMAQPFKGQPYEYIGHQALDTFDIQPTYGTREPLPEILK